MTTENVSASRNGLATTSLILGILAILIAVLLWGNILAVLLGIAAIITGGIALKQVKDQGTKGKGFAIAGFVMGSLSLVLVFLFIFVFAPVITEVFNSINQTLGAP